MKHPTKLDWIIYKIFRWWWNPIFRDNPDLVTNLILKLGTYMEQHFEPWKVPTRWEKK